MPVELGLSVALYAGALLASTLSNVWLSALGPRLHLIDTYFHTQGHAPLDVDDGDNARIDPFDFTALTSHPHATDTDANITPMFDVGLYWLPHSSHRWLPDAFVFALLPVLALTVLYRSEGGHAIKQRLCCLLQTHAVILVLRVTTSVVTVHRPSPACHSLRLVDNQHAGFILNSGCYDLMFSGHSAFCAMAAFFTALRMDWPLVVRAMVAVVGMMGCLANIVAGDHFTNDCLVGAYIAILVSWHYKARWQSTLPPAPASEARPVAISTSNGSHRIKNQ